MGHSIKKEYPLKEGHEPSGGFILPNLISNLERLFFRVPFLIAEN